MDPTQQGIIRWSAHRAHEHLQAVVPASIAIPVIAIIAGQLIALPAKPTTADRIIQGVESLGAGVLIVALLVFIYAILVAPYEQRNALRRQVLNAAKEMTELQDSVYETLRLERIESSRESPDLSKPDIFNKLLCTMHFQNTAQVPIKYSLRAMSIEIEGHPYPVVNMNDDTYRVQPDGMSYYNFDIVVNPPRGGQVIFLITYTVWYGPSTDPYMYEQLHTWRCVNSTTITPGTTNYRSAKLPGGHDILREQHS
jgi:hypothetical protein